LLGPQSFLYISTIGGAIGPSYVQTISRLADSVCPGLSGSKPFWFGYRRDIPYHYTRRSAMYRSWMLATIPGDKLLPFPEWDLTAQDTAPSLASEGTDHTRHRNCILIVDDDPGILILVSKMVRHLGFHTKTAVDGRDALETIVKHTCWLVITDDEMPSMDGYQLAEQIQERNLGTPVIIMSALQEGERLNALVASGLVAGTLLKPFNLQVLRKTIKEANSRCPERWVC
jgi:two-component system, response regulator, stage 0 sporulation protein F